MQNDIYLDYLQDSHLYSKACLLIYLSLYPSLHLSPSLSLYLSISLSPIISSTSLPLSIPRVLPRKGFQLTSHLKVGLALVIRIHLPQSLVSRGSVVARDVTGHLGERSQVPFVHDGHVVRGDRGTG